jgi:hypothetical protein
MRLRVGLGERLFETKCSNSMAQIRSSFLIGGVAGWLEAGWVGRVPRWDARVVVVVGVVVVASRGGWAAIVCVGLCMSARVKPRPIGPFQPLAWSS